MDPVSDIVKQSNINLPTPPENIVVNVKTPPTLVGLIITLVGFFVTIWVWIVMAATTIDLFESNFNISQTLQDFVVYLFYPVIELIRLIIHTFVRYLICPFTQYQKPSSVKVDKWSIFGDSLAIFAPFMYLFGYDPYHDLKKIQSHIHVSNDIKKPKMASWCYCPTYTLLDKKYSLLSWDFWYCPQQSGCEDLNYTCPQ